MNNERLAELKAKYKNRNLLEELGWGAYANHSGYTPKQNGEFLNWLCLMAYKKIRESEWIPVSEKVPEEEGRYIVSLDYGDVTIDFFDGEVFICNLGNVVAWHPLPKPYKEDEYGC
jgi:hypothetical protein